MEPDRWAEERRRGMTIDLGYAWTGLPSGEVVAFVDVPGHQRFLGNMLAGVGPAPAVLFVVAADEGWRRQSQEHLAAVHALGVRHALLAVTRSDLADPAPATAEALRHLTASSLGQVPAVAVSGATLAGLEELRAALDRLVAELPTPDLEAPVRLWVDRSFTVRGAGTVVTGTLGAGRIRVGDALQLGDRNVRVRGLQQLGSPTDEVTAVARVAVNLRDVDRAEVRRGDALLTPGSWRSTAAVDVRLTHEVNERLVLHVGSAAVPVRVRPLGGDTARLLLDAPMPLRAGDRGLLRDPAAQSVASGLTVLDADPPSLRRRGAAAARAAALRPATGRLDLATEVTRRGAARAEDLRALGLSPAAAPGVRQVAGWWVADGTWAAWSDALVRAVDSAPTLDDGLSGEAARRVVGLPDLRLLAPLADGAGLDSSSGRVRRRGSRPSLGPAEGPVAEVEALLRQHPFAAPEVPDLARLGLGPRELAAAESAGRLLRLGGDVVLLPDGPARAMRTLASLEQPFTLSAARSALGTTRRVAVPLLEHLDRQGWTERLDGSLRRVSGSQP
jgi:selenocysteine-specific elongation factor